MSQREIKQLIDTTFFTVKNDTIWNSLDKYDHDCEVLQKDPDKDEEFKAKRRIYNNLLLIAKRREIIK